MENIGTIIKLDRDQGYGFITSDIDNNNYYFKTGSLRGDICLNDQVAFNILHIEEKQYAIAIRKIKIFQTKSGLKLIYEVDSPYIRREVEPYILDKLEEIHDFDSERDVQEFEFPSVIGKSICVPTDNNDEIFYAIKKGRKGHTRFVMNREPIDSKHITIVLQKGIAYFIIVNAYIGKKAKPEPWDKQALSDDFEFWDHHAIIFGEEEIILESKTNTCPWILNSPAISKLTSKPK